MRLKPALAVACVFAFAFAAFAQQAPTNTVGAVIKLDATAKTLTLKTDAGAEVAVNVLPNAGVRRVAPGETSLANAASITLGDVAVGDRVLARGVSANQIVAATLVVVMSQSDIAKKQAADRADWEKRGVMGLVTSVGADSIVIKSRTLAGSSQVTVTAAANAVIRRYEPDSVKFADAKPAKLTDVKVGDQIRARGTKSADGTSITAEEIVSGAFKTIAGVVLAIDAQAGEMRINNIETKKPMTVKVNADSSLRKLPPPVAQAIAARVHPELARTVAAPKPAGAGGAPPAAPDFQQMLDRSPNITLADLKNGDAVVVSSTVGATADRVTAITLVAGVEPILTKPGTQQMSLGTWNLDMGGGGIAAQ
ncbi:MAG TPA: hypothetical protein VER03_20300 [Bryobacteraceae bacterium]|nr:hypothetical protein [Bryobacteraceae bacterium]